jgi:hypothetical protein
MVLLPVRLISCKAGLAGSGYPEQGSECGVSVAPAVEAEDEFNAVGLEVLAAQVMIGTQGPDLEVGKDPTRLRLRPARHVAAHTKFDTFASDLGTQVDPGRHDASGHLTDDMEIMGDAGGTRIPEPTISPGSGSEGDIGGQKI